MARKSLLLLIVSVLAVSAISIACSDDEEEAPAPTSTVEEAVATATVTVEESTVEVFLDEWSVVADPGSISAGEVTFVATNAGEEEHELVVLKTDIAPDALPVVDGKVDEASAGEEIGEIEGVVAGTQDSATFTLEPGTYVLFCNITETEADGTLESHYEEGMHTAFTVTE